MKVTVGVIVVVALGSVLIGLASPDGSVDGAVKPVNQGPRPTSATTPPSASPTATPTEEPAPGSSGPDLAPASVAGTWPGLPAKATATGKDVDWCGAVTTTGAREAERVFGRKAVDAAACAAVGFVLDHRYSRLSLPRTTYEASDFDTILPSIDPPTVADVYRPRIASFIADARSDTAGEQLGLVLFTARDTPRGAEHASAGRGHVFYGPAFTRDGYKDRAVWINPTWSSVEISVDRSSSEPRIRATLTASAALPVYATTTRSDAMLTIPTRATFLLRHGGGTTWRINGWTITRGDAAYAPLRVR